MNTSISITDQASLTSAEIAELVGSRHADVRRSIERLATDGVIRKPPTAFSEEINNLGFSVPREHDVFAGEQGKRDSIIVVAQLSPEFTARLVDRWAELERRAAQPPFQVPQSLPEALRLAADLAEQNAALEATVAEQAPKVDALERIAGADGTLCLRDAAKALQMRPIDLRNWLVAHRWIYGRPGHAGWLAYQERIQQGVLVHKVTTLPADPGESPRIAEQVRVTAKGMAKLAELLAKAAVAA